MTPEQLEALIASRRSSLLMDANAPVDDSIIDRIAQSAQWAPNHKRTWPLRIAVLRGESRRALGTVISDAMAVYGDDEAKVLKARTKYMRSPVVLVVASAVGHSDSETEENRYAVAAGIQNMLLMAESFGLSALWGSPAKGTNDAVTNLCSMASTDHVLGIIYVGWPTQSVPQVDRPDINITYLQ